MFLVYNIAKWLMINIYFLFDQFGFLTHEVEDGKKLFFHMTEVHDGADLRAGDEVEFVIVQNQRNSKYSAVSLRKLA